MNIALACGLAALLLGLGGCEKIMRDMYDQPKDKAFDASPLFANGASARLPVAGTVAREDPDAAAPPARSAALLRRGRERFDIFCSPCHSVLGDGDGAVPRRGFPPPPSFHIERLRTAPDQVFYDVISNGYGVMYAYGGRVAPADRWAIIAYIRALQLSQHAPLTQLPPQDRAILERQP